MRVPYGPDELTPKLLIVLQYTSYYTRKFCVVLMMIIKFRVGVGDQSDADVYEVGGFHSQSSRYTLMFLPS